MLWQQLQQQTIELGWDFYGPVLVFALFCLLGVPVWASIGAASTAMLMLSEATCWCERGSAASSSTWPRR